MIEVVRIIGNNIIPLFRVDGNHISDEELAAYYGLAGLSEDDIKNKLWDNPYLRWREVHD